MLLSFLIDCLLLSQARCPDLLACYVGCAVYTGNLWKGDNAS